MPYRGFIPMGSKVEAELQLSNAAAGPALVLMSFAVTGNVTGEASTTVAPGGSRKCGVDTPPNALGRLSLFVDMNSNTDTGQLTVYVDGASYDTAAITGDTKWSYSLS